MYFYLHLYKTLIMEADTLQSIYKTCYSKKIT